MNSNFSDSAAIVESIRHLAGQFGFRLVPDVVGVAPTTEMPRSRSEPESGLRLRIAAAWLRAGRLRTTALGSAFGADPAWEILLDLYLKRADRVPISVSSACLASSVPSTTALRWIAALEARGWLMREDDPHDRRRTYVTLSDDAVGRVESTLDAVVDSNGRFGLDVEPTKDIDRSLKVAQ